MSVQFGIWKFDGQPVHSAYLSKVEDLLAPYGPDGGSSYSSPEVHMLYRAFHTTKESSIETQPYATRSGAVVMWDGRLDNRAELLRALGGMRRKDDTDVAIVAAAYDRWKQDCFAKLIGDWALSIWDEKERTLLVAKDFLGARHLYYALERNNFTWSTILDPIVLLAEKPVAIEKEFLAGWLGTFPEACLTPYHGIRSVMPSSYLEIRNQKFSVRTYWNFEPARRIRYSRDAEYEEHFRSVFAEAVRRRLRSQRNIVAELSGGMDSSSIVCVADRIIAAGNSACPELDTISYFDDSEPNWNERPYFTRVEQQRGRAGCQIDVGSHKLFSLECDNLHFAPVPGSGFALTDSAKQLRDYMILRGHRVLLSGVGGDEVLGGVPTSIPELADLLAGFRFLKFASQVVAWALVNRTPLLHLLAETAGEFLPVPVRRALARKPSKVDWFLPSFSRTYRDALDGYPRRLKWFGPLPSFQENLTALDVLRRQISCSAPSPLALCEKCYPYLDRDLLEFLFAIPREQIVRPKQRRSLMRRALAGIVPEEILNRKRKAFVVRGAMLSLSTDLQTRGRMTSQMLSASLGIVDQKAFAAALQKAGEGSQVSTVTVIRTLTMELWLRHFEQFTLVRGATCSHAPPESWQATEVLP